MLRLDDLVVGIKLDGFNDAVDKIRKVKDETDGAGEHTSKLAKVWKNLKGLAIAGGTALASALVVISKKALDAYAQFEQLEGGVKKLFGKDASDLMMKQAQEAYKTAGMSANQYLQSATKFSAKLISDLGGDQVKAAKYVDKAVKQMSDNANMFGTDIGSLEQAYQGFAKGNYTMLDNLQLGFSGSKQGMEELLAKAEELTGRKFDISNFNDIIDAIQAVQDEYNITGTTAKEAAGTVEDPLSAYDIILILY